MNHLLKLDPSNTVLLAQKQELLQAAIGDTEKKLEALEQAQEDVAKAFERGDLGKDQYMAFQREVEETRGTLNRYKADLSGLQSEQERLSSNTGRLNKLFAATGSNVDDYADVLGSRLVTAIKNGTASSDQLKTAIEKIGKSATGGKADIKQLTDALDTVDDGQAVRNLIDDLNDVGDAVQDALRGVNSLMKQYGMTAQEAMDYIVRGTQNGLDKTNELGDNLSEYAGKFEQAGYSASEYFQLLQNGLEGGAYNLDKVNDAINEVTTRLADGTIGDSLDLYSEKTQSLFQAWQSGEATQKQVIDSIVADIGNCTSQQEALNMAAKAFGTMAEDGNLKFITSLTSVGDAYDSVSGSAQNLFDQTQTPMQEMEANTWKLQQALVPLGEKIVELANVVLPPLVAIITAVSFGALNISLLPVIGIIAGGGAAAIAGIIAIVKNWGAITEWFGNLWQSVASKLMGLWDGVVVFFTETIPAAFQKFIGFFSSIPYWWSGLWSLVSSFFSDTWNTILQNPIVRLVVDTVTSLWENAKKACRDRRSDGGRILSRG